MTNVDAARYARVIRGAREDVYVLATRRGLNLRQLNVEFDIDRGPGPHETHVLTLSTADKAVSVEDANIPHEWVATLGTGYIDTRFVKCVTSLLAKFEKKATELGIPV
ncbi:MAG TPA: hypothetical protein VHA15_00565 [Burkholderiales bacterium]|jgi:hypothetical protein|nr:hypothetical protein [Burkholderiales bacterium]